MFMPEEVVFKKQKEHMPLLSNLMPFNTFNIYRAKMLYGHHFTSDVISDSSFFSRITMNQNQTSQAPQIISTPLCDYVGTGKVTLTSPAVLINVNLRGIGKSGSIYETAKVHDVIYFDMTSNQTKPV
jgi:hypothetical protein